MRTSQIFRVRSNRSNFFKIGLCIVIIYGVYVFLQMKVTIQQSQPITTFPQKDYRMLDFRKLSLHLNMPSNHNNRLLEARKREEIYESSHQFEGKNKKKVKFANGKRISMNVKVDVSINDNSDIGKSLNTWNKTFLDQMKGMEKQGGRSSDVLQVTGGSLRVNIMQKKEKIISKRKYIFTLRYYEQLAGATKNLIDLASLAKHYSRGVVMPFVNNSRMDGIQERGEMRANKARFNNLSRYFDITHLNTTLFERGYAPLTHFSDFIRDCKNGIDVLAHFIYNDSFSANDAKNWFGVGSKSWLDLRTKMPHYGGVQPCDFLRKSGIERLLGGVTVKEYVCVDPEIIRTAAQIERAVFRKKSCIGILQWKGIGKKRTHFALPESIFQTLKPSDIAHNRTLVDIAKNFIERFVKQPFLAVHIRAERQLSWFGLDRVLKCINSLSKRALQRTKTFQIQNVFLATDLPKYGSDTYKSTVNEERIVVQRYINQLLRKPITFRPELYGRYDKGDISIIEMNILSFGESLYTIGGGKFQQWVVELFMSKNTEDHSLLHRICLEKLS